MNIPQLTMERLPQIKEWLKKVRVLMLEEIAESERIVKMAEEEQSELEKKLENVRGSIPEEITELIEERTSIRSGLENAINLRREIVEKYEEVFKRIEKAEKLTSEKSTEFELIFQEIKGQQPRMKEFAKQVNGFELKINDMFTLKLKRIEELRDTINIGSGMINSMLERAREFRRMFKGIIEKQQLQIQRIPGDTNDLPHNSE